MTMFFLKMLYLYYVNYITNFLTVLNFLNDSELLCRDSFDVVPFIFKINNNDNSFSAFGDDELGASRCLEVQIIFMFSYFKNYFQVEELASIREHYDDVKCTPEPDAMNPCESIVG